MWSAGWHPISSELMSVVDGFYLNVLNNYFLFPKMMF